MSGFEALGAAAAIIQLVELGIKLGNKAVALHKSSHGLDSRLQSLDETTKEFQSRNTDLLDKSFHRASLTSPSSADDDALRRIAARCQQTAAELMQMVEDVRMKKQSKRNAIWYAWKSDHEYDNIKEKQNELRAWRRECTEQVQKMILDNQYAMARTYLDIAQRQRDSQTAASNQLLSQMHKIQDMLNNASTRGTPGLANILLDTQKTGAVVLPREDILSSLFFMQMQLRWDGISKPTESTYEWIFNRDESLTPQIRFVKWLEQDDGTFWITGKAGSGKSTLMKFIRHHEQTEKGLQQWANGRHLFIADYYFWYRGDDLQNSHEGLLRSILYKVLEQCPDLIESICQTRWKQAADGRNIRNIPWTVTELQECAKVLTNTRLSFEGREVCFCFFVDGLDEYRGNTEDIVETLEQLATGPNIKICASSRPWNEFKFAFQSSSKVGNSVQVHMHTESDIRLVADTELRHVLTKLGRERDELEPLVSEITEMSQGVFLWVTLVLRKELIPMLKAWENVDALHRRLREIPDDLMEYFRSIFDKVWKDTKYRKDTARIFCTCLATRSALFISCLDIMVDDDPESLAHKATIGHPFAWDDPITSKAAIARLNARCLDLLSVEGYSAGASVDLTPLHRFRLSGRITFLHRTVADFLIQDTVAHDLAVHSGKDFDADTTLFACHAFLAKKLLSFGPEDNIEKQEMARIFSTWSLSYCPRPSARESTTRLIEDIDEAMGRLHVLAGTAHWTNYMVLSSQELKREDSGLPTVQPVIQESANRDITGHLIEFGLIEQVKSRLATDTSSVARKKGRPYLDYALRHDMEAEFRQQKLQNRSEFFAESKYDVEMVEMLLTKGCDANQPVWIYEGRTVWDLFLAHIYDNRSDIDTESTLAVAKLLIKAGAKNVPRCILRESVSDVSAKYHEASSHHKELSMQQILEQVFGAEQGKELATQVKQNNASNWFRWSLWG